MGLGRYAVAFYEEEGRAFVFIARAVAMTEQSKFGAAWRKAETTLL